MSLQNDTVIFVVGGSGSLGRVVVETLSKSSKKLVFSYYKNLKLATELESCYNCRKVQLDLRNQQTFDGIINNIEQDIGAIETLIFCSGYDYSQMSSKFLELNMQKWNEANQVDVQGQFFLTQLVAKGMVKRKTGKIIFTGSVSSVKSVPSSSVYTSNKSAIVGLMRSLSKELGQCGILVNSVEPGILEGGVSKSLSEELIDEYKKYSCMSRLGKFQEVANVIEWLSSSENSYLVGQSIVLDGGI